ncbi:hypothetical protein Q3G72_032061 [Acer saccharum]|nr:hypothetical protein Q3G72_032061 [Acer saccharum]
MRSHKNEPRFAHCGSSRRKRKRGGGCGGSMEEPHEASTWNSCDFGQEACCWIVTFAGARKCHQWRRREFGSVRVSDGSSLTTFMRNWAETARNSNINNVGPKIVGTTIFPPMDKTFANPSEYPPKKNVLSKRFMFSNSNISALQEKYVATSGTESSKTYPSRYKTLTSFLWSRFAASTEIKKGPKTSYLLASPVNFRKMMDPPLPDDSFGNLSGVALTVVSSEDDIEKEGYNYGIVNKLTRAISLFNKDSVKKLQDGKFDNPLNWEGVDENTFKGESFGLCSVAVWPANRVPVLALYFPLVSLQRFCLLHNKNRR